MSYGLCIQERAVVTYLYHDEAAHELHSADCSRLSILAGS